MSHNGTELEARLAAVPSNGEAAQQKAKQVPVPVALAFGVFDCVIGTCRFGAKALREMRNEEAAAILDSMHDELMARAKAMYLEATRRVALYTPDQAPPA